MGGHNGTLLVAAGSAGTLGSISCLCRPVVEVFWGLQASNPLVGVLFSKRRQSNEAKKLLNNLYIYQLYTV